MTPTARPGKGTLRVVAGSRRGRRLDSPGSTVTRPTADRVRESVFNALESLGAVQGAVVLDGFAGSGALGIEALSRGAARVVFAETDRGARDVVAGNLRQLELTSLASVRPTPADRTLASDGPFDLILLDPPYGFDRWSDLLDLVASALTDDGVVVLESDRELPLPAALHGIRCRTYGGTVVQFATPAGAPS